jgi:hypothetical protein
LVVAGLAVESEARQSARDLDRDGVADQLEQALLERFIPTFLLAKGECDGAPASFVPNRSDPFVRSKDGTLYGQAFALRSTDARPRIELHYFHLWSRDCGRLGHDLDAEHISAIVSASRIDAPASMWTAGIWYAAAHEGSSCDASSGARAHVVGAEANGPRVFISKGKHASYFDRGQCKWGCGADQCEEDRVIVPQRVINIGERNAALNGASWVHSKRWPLAEKLSSDFDPALRARLDADDGDHVIALMQHLRAPQAPVFAGDTAIDGLETAATHTSGAFFTATKAVRKFFLRMMP